MVEEKAAGVYNANGLPGKLTMQDLLEACKDAGNSDAAFTWATEDFLLLEEVAPWSQMPLWLPEAAAPHLKGFMFINSDKAMAAGLTLRSLSDTIGDTLNWFQATRAHEELKAGIDAGKEQSLLNKWHRLLTS
jgi:2'-hydroxyisoflavone reductase